MGWRPGGLWRHPDFMKMWIGQTVSAFGSHISAQAIPLAALLVLAAGPAEMGFLVAVGEVPVLLVGLFAGVWVDRLRRRPIMMAADVGRALMLASIPLAAFFGMLSLVQLYAVAALVGVLTVFFDVADQSYLPTLVERENLIEGNSKRSASSSIAEIGGPSLGGILVQTLSAPLAILIDAVSFLFSAVTLGLIRKPEPASTSVHEQEPMSRAIAQGLRVVLGDRVLRALAGSLATTNFFGNFFATLYALLIIRELNLPPSVLGIAIGAGGIGALFGAFIAGRVVRAFGVGSSIGGAIIFAGSMQVVLLLLGGPQVLVITLLLATQIVGDVAWAVYDIAATSLRQALIPDHLLGRANATMNVLAGGIAPIGALLGGILGTAIGIRATLAIAVAGIILASLWIFLSPARHISTYPAQENAPELVL